MKRRIRSRRTNRSAPGGRDFGRDDRAVSPLLGAILLFALLLSLLVLIQVTAVPGWNQQVEYDHNQRVQEDMRGFEAAVGDAGRLDRPSSAVVENGAEYPTRPFLFNPPDPAGTTETTAEEWVNFSNVELTGVDTVWLDGTSNYTTVGFQYDPGYNEYANAPVTRYENGVLYNEYPDAVVLLTGSSLVDGRDLNVVTLDGSVSSTQGGASTVSVEPLAGESHPVSVQSRDGSNLVLEFPTRLDVDTWRTLLADERSANGGYVENLTVTDGTLRIELRAETAGPDPERIQYQLRMGKVGIDGGEREGAHYVARISDPSVDVSNGTAATISVEVRNRYNNPVAGESVTFEPTVGSGTFVGQGSTATVVTGQDGRATVQFRPSENATVTASADLDGGGEPRESTTVDVTVSTPASTTIVETSFDDRENVIVGDGFGSEQLYYPQWHATARWGNNATGGSWELQVKNDETGATGQADRTWTNNATVPFELEYNKNSNNARLIVGTGNNATKTPQNFDVPRAFRGRVAFTVKSENGTVGTRAAIDDLQVDGASVGPVDGIVAETGPDGEREVKYLLVREVAPDRFTITGTLTFGWDDEPLDEEGVALHIYFE